jgi:hypothetical protein
MTLAERLSEFVRAAFTGLWIQSFEHDDAIAEIASLCRQQHWALSTWDIDRGLNLQDRDTDSGTAVSAGDPLARGDGQSRRYHRLVAGGESQSLRPERNWAGSARIGRQGSDPGILPPL